MVALLQEAPNLQARRVEAQQREEAQPRPAGLIAAVVVVVEVVAAVEVVVVVEVVEERTYCLSLPFLSFSICLMSFETPKSLVG